MADSNDCLNQELQEIDNVLRKKENKKKELAELKHEIEECHQHHSQSAPESSRSRQNSGSEDKLRENLHDQIAVMNVDQMAEVHNWLKHSGIDDIEKM